MGMPVVDYRQAGFDVGREAAEQGQTSIVSLPANLVGHAIIFEWLDGVIDGVVGRAHPIRGLNLPVALMQVFRESPNSDGNDRYRGIRFAAKPDLYPDETIEVVT